MPARDAFGRYPPGTSGNKRGRPAIPADLVALAKVHTLPALQALIDCVTDIEAPWPSRIQAAIHLLDRGWGRCAPTSDYDDGERITSLVLSVVNVTRSATIEPAPSPGIITIGHADGE